MEAVESAIRIVGSLSAVEGGMADDMGDISGVVGSRVAASPPVLDRTPRERERERVKVGGGGGGELHVDSISTKHCTVYIAQWGKTCLMLPPSYLKHKINQLAVNHNSDTTNTS